MQRSVDLLSGQVPLRDSRLASRIAFRIVENDDCQRTSERNKRVAAVARLDDDHDAIVARLVIEIASAGVQGIDVQVCDPWIIGFEQRRPDANRLGALVARSRATR